MVVLAILLRLAIYGYSYYKYSHFRVSISHDKVTYDGKISVENVKALIGEYERSNLKPNRLVINSTGGHAGAGMHLGKWLYNNKMDVEVDKFCFSSCANYIFTAGNQKFLNKRSVLGWHGGALSGYVQDEELFSPLVKNAIAQQNISSEEQRQEYINKMDKIRKKFIRMESEFFQLVGVNPLITTAGGTEGEYSRVTLNSENYDGNLEQHNNIAGFYYTLEDMEKFGLQNITLKSGSWKSKAKISGAKILLADLTEFWAQQNR